MAKAQKKNPGNPITLPEVEVTAPAPSWLQYQHQFEKTFPKAERLQQYLTPMARALGNSTQNYPQRIDQQYNSDMNDFVARNLMLERNGDNYTDRERQLISASRYKDKSREYAYKNPVKLPVSSDDPYLNYLYHNDFLTKIPGVRQIIQHMAGNKISQTDIENGYHNGNQTANAQLSNDDPLNYRNNKVDMLSQYLHNDQDLSKSSYSPSQDYFSFLPSYSLKNKLGVADNFPEITREFTGQMESLKKQPVFLNGLGTAPYKNSPDLGHYKSGVAWDKQKELPYYFVSDSWDFDPSDYSRRYGENPQQSYMQSYLMHEIGNPYKIYDRFYFNGDTGDYIPDEATGIKQKKLKKGGKVQVNPSKNRLPKAAFGYDIESINTGYRGDPTALQNPIPVDPIQTLDTNDPVSTPSFKMPRMQISLGPSMIGLASLANNHIERSNQLGEQSRITRMRATSPDYNPNRYGNGSQILYRQGGTVKNESDYQTGKTYKLSTQEIKRLKALGYEIEEL